MIRISELKVPLSKEAPSEAALKPYVCKALGISENELLWLCTFKRSYDARRGVMALTFIIDCAVANEAEVLQKHVGNPHIKPAPDISYKPVAQAPAGGAKDRPIVVGFGGAGFLPP